MTEQESSQSAKEICAEIVRRARERDDIRTIVLSGYSAVGKSTYLLPAMKAVTQGTGKCLSASSYSRPRELREEAGISGIHPDGYYFQEMRADLQGLTEGVTITIQTYDMRTGSTSEKSEDLKVSASELLILDGLVWLSVTSTIPQVEALKVAVLPGDVEQFREKTLGRDIEKKGYDRQYAEQALAQRERDLSGVYFSQIQACDILISVSPSYEYEIVTGNDRINLLRQIELAP